MQAASQLQPVPPPQVQQTTPLEQVPTLQPRSFHTSAHAAQPTLAQHALASSRDLERFLAEPLHAPHTPLAASRSTLPLHNRMDAWRDPIADLPLDMGLPPLMPLSAELDAGQMHAPVAVPQAYAASPTRRGSGEDLERIAFAGVGGLPTCTAPPLAIARAQAQPIQASRASQILPSLQQQGGAAASALRLVPWPGQAAGVANRQLTKRARTLVGRPAAQHHLPGLQQSRHPTHATTIDSRGSAQFGMDQVRSGTCKLVIPLKQDTVLRIGLM